MTSGCAAGGPPSTRGSGPAARASPQVGLQDEARARPIGELGLGEQLEHEVADRLARVEGLHVDVQVGARGLRAAQELAQARRGVGLAELGRVGPQERRQRGDLHGEVGPGERSCAVGLEQRARRPRRGGGRELVERVGAAGGVGVGLGAGDRRLPEQVDRGRNAVLPQTGEDLRRLLGRLPDDEAVGHVLDAARGGGAQRGAPGLAAAQPHGLLERHGLLVDLREEAAEVLREVVDRPAGGDHVDEAEQRRLELRVARGEVHRLVVECRQRSPDGGGHRLRQLPPDREDVGIGGRRRKVHGPRVRLPVGAVARLAAHVLPARRDGRRSGRAFGS
jgi:hypothetical protein